MNKVGGGTGSTRAYLLGHSEPELQRLTRQAKLVDPMTRRFLERAGIGPGMRVLDIGSGAGDVAFLAADLVGPTGQVVGVDRVRAALDTARARAEKRALKQVSFLEGDPARMAFDTSFDAVVGRYVLMFQEDPVAMVRGVAGQVRPGGIVVFHEIDWAGSRTFPPAPLYEECCRWIVRAIEENGADPRMGIKLGSTFVAAGLPAPALALEALVGGGDDLERIGFVAELVGTLQEGMVRAGIASAAQIGLDTLAARVAEEAIKNRSVLACRSEIAAWCVLPG